MKGDTLVVGDDLNTPLLVDTDTGVGGTEIDTWGVRNCRIETINDDVINGNEKKTREEAEMNGEQGRELHKTKKKRL